ncbi:hypothetical protein U9M48_033501 [Paspalum notatum var. saurae]|uniref:CASP-like protein n=1 Tax=Paspalum notatum var. saurae TaxID=547442 RepID=A0AAQ3UA80_PASNO
MLHGPTCHTKWWYGGPACVLFLSLPPLGPLGLEPGGPGGGDEDDSSVAAATRRRRVRAFDSGTVLDMSLRLAAGVRGGVRVVQLLLTTAILAASKFVEDRNYSNAHFAAVGGLAAAELGALELRFMFLMQFRLNVCTSVFQSYCRHLEREEVSHGAGYRRIEKPLRPFERVIRGGHIVVVSCACEQSSRIDTLSQRSRADPASCQALARRHPGTLTRNRADSIGTVSFPPPIPGHLSTM